MVKHYVWTFVGLIALTTLTLGLSFVSLGAWGIPLALLIALAKAVLLALFFMHLTEQGTANWVTFLISALMVATMIGLAVLDVASRFLVAPPGPGPA